MSGLELSPTYPHENCDSLLEMSPLRIKFDQEKAQGNLRKHGVSFEEAQTVFLDPFAITVPDDAHSDEENREITLGYSERSRMLIVVHTEEVDGELRIISARKANAYEKAQYPHA